MNLLFTGASGFLGTIIDNELASKFSLLKLGRSHSNQIIADLKNGSVKLNSKVQAVIHAAGKAHVYPKTEEDKADFYNVNVIGTKHLLESLKDQKLSHFVFVSSVSVYGLESGEHISEGQPLNGNSPYAKSKIEAEKIIQAYCLEKGIHFLILRLPLVVGKNPLGNLGKMIEAITKGRYVRIAKGNAKKSMVLGQDVAHLILNWLHTNDPASGVYNLTDGYHPTFFEVEEAIKKGLNASWIPSIPTWLGLVLGKIGDVVKSFPVNSGTIKKITGTFTFSDQKARKEIGWKSRHVIEHLV